MDGIRFARHGVGVLAAVLCGSTAMAGTITGTAQDVDRSALRDGAAPPAAIDLDGPPDRTPTNNYWKLVELGGAPVVAVSGASQPHVILHLDGNRVTGSGGCNPMKGTYVLHGDFVSFGSLGAPKKTCGEGTKREGEYFRALARVKSWRVHGDTLELLDAANVVVLKFAAVDLR